MRKTFRGWQVPWEVDPELYPRTLDGRNIPWSASPFAFCPDTGRLGMLRVDLRPDKKSDKVLVGAISDPHVFGKWHMTWDSPVLSFEDAVKVVAHCRSEKCSIAQAMIALHSQHSKVTSAVSTRWADAPDYFPKDVAEQLNEEHGYTEAPARELERLRAQNARLRQAEEIVRLREENATLEASFAESGVVTKRGPGRPRKELAV